MATIQAVACALPSASVAPAAALMADPARACMLSALLDGRSRPAGDLARAAGITAQTASFHLARMLDGGLLAVTLEGRHRYYRLAGPEVAQALESLAALAPTPRAPRGLTREQRHLRAARRCYDHLAGLLGVAVHDALLARDALRAEGEAYAVTESGADWFTRMGLDLPTLRPTKRGLARPCLDWTECCPHLGGPLGVALMSCFCAKGWLRRSDDSRLMAVTPLGQAGLRASLGVRNPQ